MNAQFSIQAPPKYNFPLPDNLQLPRKIVELSARSLRNGNQLQPLLGDTSASCIHSRSNSYTKSYTLTASPIEASLVKLTPDRDKAPIVGIDVSSITLGETRTGVLIAVRGAIVWKRDSRYRYLRLGPFPFHITENSESEIVGLFHQDQQAAHQQTAVAPHPHHLQAKLATLLEQWMQMSVSQTTRDSVILWDGSLTIGPSLSLLTTMEKALRTARGNSNAILAFSKMTRLLLSGKRLTDLVNGHPPPCLLRIVNSPSRLGSLRLLGNLYVAKLAGNSCVFRLDVDKRLAHFEVVKAVQKLIGNDTVQQSYPETLRLAHIMCTFTAADVLGLQRLAAKEANINVLTRPSMRRVLFGPFGKEGRQA